MEISIAKTTISCDGCKAVLDLKGDDKDDAIAATLEGSDGKNKQFHFCSESCLASFLTKRVKREKAKASVEDNGYFWSLDITADAAYVSPEERNNPSTHYLDESRKSFPIRKGKECVDLEASVKAWGRYKGSMSHSEFVSKVKSLMKKHGCKIPESWASVSECLAKCSKCGTIANIATQPEICMGAVKCEKCGNPVTQATALENNPR